MSEEPVANQHGFYFVRTQKDIYVLTIRRSDGTIREVFVSGGDFLKAAAPIGNGYSDALRSRELAILLGRAKGFHG